MQIIDQSAALMRHPTADEIALSVKDISDFTPIAELAKAVCLITGRGAYDSYHFGNTNIQLTGWQLTIAEAQIMTLMGML